MAALKKKKKHTKATATAVAAVTAAGVMVGGAFASPDEIMNDGPDAIVQTIAVNTQVPVDADGGDGGTDIEEEIAAGEEDEKHGIYAAVRKAVRSAPREVRAAVAVPLWGVGTVIIALLSSLWTGILSPAASAVLSWLGVALMAVLAFALAVKTAFPNLPLKKILNKRSILCIGIMCLVCGIADAALPFFWEDYTKLSNLLKVFGSLICTGVPLAVFLRRHKRKEPKVTIEAEPVELPPSPEPTMEEKEAAARALVEELADSVCPRAY